MIKSIKFKQSDLDRITQKIKKLESNVMDTKKLYYVIEHYAKAYRNGVVKVMGSVEAATTDMEGGGNYGARGYPVITFEDLSATPPGGWEPLSQMAIKNKQRLGSRVTFWYQTGETFGAVGHSVQVGSYYSDRVAKVFAGIDKQIDPDAWKHAWITEVGGVNEEGRRVPARALFTIANELFKTKREEIEKAVKAAIFDGVNWGAK